MNSSLSKEWRKKFSSYKEDDEKQGVMQTIERVEKHDKFAGLLGIMPIGLHDVMTKPNFPKVQGVNPRVPFPFLWPIHSIHCVLPLCVKKAPVNLALFAF